MRSGTAMFRSRSRTSIMAGMQSRGTTGSHERLALHLILAVPTRHRRPQKMTVLSGLDRILSGILHYGGDKYTTRYFYGFLWFSGLTCSRRLSASLAWVSR